MEKPYIFPIPMPNYAPSDASTPDLKPEDFNGKVAWHISEHATILNNIFNPEYSPVMASFHDHVRDVSLLTDDYVRPLPKGLPFQVHCFYSKEENDDLDMDLFQQ